jgi:hypothetical protein
VTFTLLALTVCVKFIRNLISKTSVYRIEYVCVCASPSS